MVKEWTLDYCETWNLCFGYSTKAKGLPINVIKSDPWMHMISSNILIHWIQHCNKDEEEIACRGERDAESSMAGR